MFTRFQFFMLFSILNLGWLNAQNFYGPEPEIAQIKTNINNFSQYYMSGKIDSLTNCYTVDGKIFPSGTPIIIGLEAIKKKWTLPVGVKILRHKVTPEEIRIIDNYAYDYGYYTGATQRRDGSQDAWQGKYVIVWKKVETEWKIYLDIWNHVNAPKPATTTTAKPSVQDHPEFTAVKAAIEDYVLGLYLQDPSRIVNSVDSTLHKTGFWFNKETMKFIDNLEMSYSKLVDLAGEWNKTGEQANQESPREITIFDITNKTASAKLTAEWGMDYFHLAKVNGQWKIRNVLWQSLPEKK